MEIVLVMKKKVLICYQYIAAYREPVFTELTSSSYFEYDFCSDVQSRGGIKLVDDDFYKKSNFVRVKNIWFKNMLIQRGVLSSISKGKYDVIVFLADPFFITTWVASYLAKRRGIKVVFWTHGIVRDNSLKSKLKLLFYKIPNLIFLYGKSSESNLIKKGVPAEKLVPIFNSLDYPLHSRLRDLNSDVANKGFMKFDNPNLFQLIFIGRLTDHKKLDMIIYLMSGLEKKGIFTNLLFVGDGPARSNLESLAFDFYHLQGRIHFYGQCYSEDELAPLIVGSDCCVSPGEVGLTAMHVMSYGLPVITHDEKFSQMPEFEAVQDGKTGRLFKKDDFDSLVDVTYELISKPIVNIRENCIKLIESKYTPSSQCNIIESSLKGLFDNEN